MDIVATGGAFEVWTTMTQVVMCYTCMYIVRLGLSSSSCPGPPKAPWQPCLCTKDRLSLLCTFFRQWTPGHLCFLSEPKSKYYFIGWHSLRREGYIASITQSPLGLNYVCIELILINVFKLGNFSNVLPMWDRMWQSCAHTRTVTCTMVWS